MGPKRRRLALSCVACRQRKVKCDRTYPTCVRCQKGGVNCDYVAYTNATLPTPSDQSPHLRREGSATSWTDEASVWHQKAKDHQTAQSHEDHRNSMNAGASRAQPKSLQQLQDRVHGLERQIRTAGYRSAYPGFVDGTGYATAQANGIDKEAERGLLRGKSFKTQYFGPSNGASLLLQFEELSRFVKDVISRLPVLERSRMIWKQQRKGNGGSLVLPDFESLVSLVPEQSRADLLVQEYFETMETTYRVLHAPIFFRRYKEFWTSTTNVTTEAFLIQLLLICAAVNCSVPGNKEGFLGRSTVGHDAAVKWIEVCENWLVSRSRAHPVQQC
jgi:hypothetical protein